MCDHGDAVLQPVQDAAGVHLGGEEGAAAGAHLGGKWHGERRAVGAGKGDEGGHLGSVVEVRAWEGDGR